MDFIPVTYSAEEKRRNRKLMSRWIGAGALGVAQAPVLVLTGLVPIAEALPFGLTFVGFGLGVLSMIAVPSTIADERRRNRQNARTEFARTSLNEHYGLRLSPEQFAALSYPREDPGSGFQTFGSVKIQDQVDGGNFLERTLYLIATDGELKLSESRDGKRFKELKPVRRALEGSSAQKALDEAHPSETLETLSAPVGVSA